MKNAKFSVNLGELEDGPKHLDGPLPSDWLRQTLEGTEVEPAKDPNGRLDVILTRNGADVLVRGHLEVTVSIPCARTLDPAIYRLEPEIFLMLSPAASQDFGARGSSRERARHGKKTSRKGGWENDPELSDEDAARDTYSGDHVVLDDFLREFILLEVPMLPLREDLRDVPFEANPPLPGASLSAQAGTVADDDKPIDPRLSPLRDLKARLEKKE